MKLVDTNIILRWLLGDNAVLSPKAEELVKEADRSSLLITDVIVAEIVYILRSTGRDRSQTSEALQLLGRTEAFKFENEELVIKITTLLIGTTLDFADCYLLAKAHKEKIRS